MILWSSYYYNKESQVPVNHLAIGTVQCYFQLVQGLLLMQHVGPGVRDDAAQPMGAVAEVVPVVDDRMVLVCVALQESADCGRVVVELQAQTQSRADNEDDGSPGPQGHLLAGHGHVRLLVTA